MRLDKRKPEIDRLVIQHELLQFGDSVVPLLLFSLIHKGKDGPLNGMQIIWEYQTKRNEDVIIDARITQVFKFDVAQADRQYLIDILYTASVDWWSFFQSAVLEQGVVLAQPQFRLDETVLDRMLQAIEDAKG